MILLKCLAPYIFPSPLKIFYYRGVYLYILLSIKNYELPVLVYLIKSQFETRAKKAKGLHVS